MRRRPEPPEAGSSPELEEPLREVLVGAARRFALLVLGAATITAAISLAIGVVAGVSASRSLSLGLYLAGFGALLVGFALGLRGASPRERTDAISDSALFVVLGFALLALGVLADTRYPLL
jgi:uncharacterized membrane protein